MTVASVPFGGVIPDFLDKASQAAAPYYYEKGQQGGTYASAELIKALALLQMLASSLYPYLLTHMTRSSRITPSISGIPAPTATTTTDVSYVVLLQSEELFELSLPRLPLSVQRVSVSFVLRERGIPRLVGGSDVVAD